MEENKRIKELERQVHELLLEVALLKVQLNILRNNRDHASNPYYDPYRPYKYPDIIC